MSEQRDRLATALIRRHIPRALEQKNHSREVVEDEALIFQAAQQYLASLDAADDLERPSFETAGDWPTCETCGRLLAGHWRGRPCVADPSAEQPIAPAIGEERRKVTTSTAVIRALDQMVGGGVDTRVEMRLVGDRFPPFVVPLGELASLVAALDLLADLDHWVTAPVKVGSGSYHERIQTVLRDCGRTAV
jgi:hypothetical protein